MIITGQDRVVEQQFTAKERDAESGLDYFGARFFMAPAGRFLSPDAPFADQFVENPQSWNLYSYTRNNPLSYVDNNGEYVETTWDVANIAIGVTSFVSNVRQGDYGAAAIDAVGVVADSVAAAVPIVPGGAGTVIRGARIADKVGDTVGGVAGAAAAVRKVDKAADAAKVAGDGPSFIVSKGGDVIPVPAGQRLRYRRQTGRAFSSKEERVVMAWNRE